MAAIEHIQPICESCGVGDVELKFVLDSNNWICTPCSKKQQTPPEMNEKDHRPEIFG